MRNVLIVPIAMAPRIRALLDREYERATGQRLPIRAQWNGRGKRPQAQHFTRHFVDFDVSEDGTQAAFPVVEKHGVSVAAVIGKTLSDASGAFDVPDASQFRDDETWFKPQ